MVKSTQIKTITVVGAGYVGLTTAAIFANSGIKTYLLDIDDKKVKKINAGIAPFYESGLEALIKSSLKNKKLTPTTSYHLAIPESQVVFCCAGTPDKPDGSSNLDFVFAALEKAASLARDGVIFVQKSTVPVGTGRSLERTITKVAPKLKFSYISNPEFLREGSAISDTLNPDRVVIGGDDEQARQTVAKLYLSIGKTSLKSKIYKSDFIYTTLESAELIKVSANAFLALKISFANSIAKLSDKVNGDIVEVMRGVGKDSRIGSHFLNAGRGYGGGCFPKDVSGLISAAKSKGVSLEIMSAASATNSSMPEYIVNKLKGCIGPIRGKRIALLGLAFKAGTSDTRRSPAVVIANMLIKEGAAVEAYDPQAKFDDGELSELAKRVKKIELAASDADALVITTDWPEFTILDFAQLKSHMRGNVILDCMNCLDKKKIESVGLIYLGVGR